MEHLSQVASLFQDRRSGLMADLDGTLSEMVVRPEDAVTSPAIQEALRQLSQDLPVVAVITGRSAEDGLRMVGVEELIYIGNHGLERLEKGEHRTVEAFAPYQAELREAIKVLGATLDVPGLWLEDKGVSMSLHYRHCENPAQAHREILRAIDALPNSDKFLTIGGKMVVNLLPAIGSTKGSAVNEMVEEHGLSGGLFMGDDLTDLDAFRAIQKLRRDSGFRGMNVAVLGGEEKQEVIKEADFILDNVGEVSRLLTWLAQQND
jgi:trehalose 6-phosphate phosphatase